MTTAAIVGAAILFGRVVIPRNFFQTRDEARRQESKYNLKGIGLALHNYHDAAHMFPPGGIFNSRETGFFGWTVLIMPYVTSGVEYNMIDFGVPWNDPRNADIFRRPYPWYLNPSIPQTLDSDGFVLTHYAASKNVLFPNSSVSIDDISDGLHQTILGGEIAEEFLPYARPGNWRDPAIGINASPKSFGRPTRDGAYLLMADGAVIWFSNSIDPAVLRALSTPAGSDEPGTKWP